MQTVSTVAHEQVREHNTTSTSVHISLSPILESLLEFAPLLVGISTIRMFFSFMLRTIIYVHGYIT